MGKEARRQQWEKGMAGDLIKPDELRRITDQMEMEKMREAFEKKRKSRRGAA